MERATAPESPAPTQPAPRLPTEFYPGPRPAEAQPRRGAWCPLRALAIAVVVVLVVVLLCYACCQRAPGSPAARLAPRPAPGSLAARLAQKGWDVYLMEGCGHCQRQMGLLGGYGRSAVCVGGKGTPPAACAGITGYPHWRNAHTGESRVGYQDAAALEKMASGSRA